MDNGRYCRLCSRGPVCKLWTMAGTADCVHVVLFVSCGQWQVLQVVFTKCIVVFEFVTDGSDVTL